MFVVDVAGGEPVTNQPQILERRRRRASTRTSPTSSDELVDGLLDAPVGLSDVSVEEAGRMRVLTRPIAERRPAASERSTSPTR